MTKRLLMALSVLMLNLLTILPATIPVAMAATPLQEQDVENFLGSMEDVRQFAEELKEEGKAHIFETEGPGADQFAPYTNGVEGLRAQSPEDYQALGKIAEQNGFDSQDEWARIGDRVMMSFVALKTIEMNPEYKQMAEQITPEMMAKMPAEARVQIERSLELIERVKETPAADQKTVEPYMPKIEAWLSSAAEQTAQ